MFPKHLKHLPPYSLPLKKSQLEFICFNTTERDREIIYTIFHALLYLFVFLCAWIEGSYVSNFFFLNDFFSYNVSSVTTFCCFIAKYYISNLKTLKQHELYLIHANSKSAELHFLHVTYNSRFLRAC